MAGLYGRPRAATTEQDLNNVAFLDKAIPIIVSARTTLLRSGNAGQRWLQSVNISPVTVELNNLDVEGFD